MAQRFFAIDVLFFSEKVFFVVKFKLPRDLQKVGSAAEVLCPRLQGHSRSKRDFLPRGGMTERYKKSPAIRPGILNGA